jgi:hypothetical protein
VTVTAPGTSSRGRTRGPAPGIRDGARATTSAATGTLMRNAQRQERSSVSSPPRTAPAVKPDDISAPLRPSARSRSGPSRNAVVSRARPAGVTAAVARPCNTRATTSISGDTASPPSKEEAPSTIMPPRNSRLRPTRSAIRPRSSVSPAAARAKAVEIHGRSASGKPSPLPTAGRATFRMEKSTATMNCAPRSRARTTFWWPVIGGARGASSVAGGAERAAVGGRTPERVAGGAGGVGRGLGCAVTGAAGPGTGVLGVRSDMVVPPGGSQGIVNGSMVSLVIATVTEQKT